MEQYSYHICKAFERELRTLIAERAARDNGDDHEYQLRSLKIEYSLRADAMPIVTIKLAVKYHDPYADDDEEPFEDEYNLRYGINTNGRLAYFAPEVPETQQQVFEAYDTWGFVVIDWLQDIRRFYNRAARKQRFAPIHEELVAKMWHPDRVASILERGGWDLMEAVM